jgi:hypothetical protein
MSEISIDHTGRHEFLARVAAQNEGFKPKKKPKLKSLECVKCSCSLGAPRPGSGRQKELCDDCFADNRLENCRRQDIRRREERRAVR